MYALSGLKRFAVRKILFSSELSVETYLIWCQMYKGLTLTLITQYVMITPLIVGDALVVVTPSMSYPCRIPT